MINGDCLAVMRSMADGSFDTIITSPPYNLGNSSTGEGPVSDHYRAIGSMTARGGQGKFWRASGTHGIANGYGEHDDAMPHDEYVAWQKECLAEMWRLLSPAGAIFYNHKPRILNGRLVTPFDYNPGLPVRQVVIWARAGGVNFSPTYYLPTHEWIMVLAKDEFRLKSKGASGVGDVWHIPQEPGCEHPAPFPLKLPKRILSTINAARVLDPFAGSGTVGVACIAAGVEFVGIEKNPEYVRLARGRHAKAMGAGSMFASATSASLFN